LTCQFYFGAGKFLGPREEEESRSDNQEEENIDGTGEAEHRVTKKCSRRRYLVVTEQQPPCYSERKDDKGVC